MIKLLVVNCYREKAEEKIKPYLKAIEETGIVLEKLKIIRDFQLEDEHISFTAAVLSGSQKMVGEEEYESRLVDFIRNFRKPLLGICYGHQILAKSFGAEVKRDRIHHKGIEKIQVLRKIPVLEGLPEVFEAAESHHEIVVATEAFLKEFEIAAVNEAQKDLVEAIAHRNLPYYGLQFHPEKTQLGPLVFRNFLKTAHNLI